MELAIVNLVRDAGGITAEDATVHVARLYGWARVGMEIRGRLGSKVEKLVANGTLTCAGAELAAAAQQ